MVSFSFLQTETLLPGWVGVGGGGGLEDQEAKEIYKDGEAQKAATLTKSPSLSLKMQGE